MSSGIWLSSSWGDALDGLLDDVCGRFDNGSHSDVNVIDEFVWLAAVGEGPNSEFVNPHSLCAQHTGISTADSAVGILILEVSGMGRNAADFQANKTDFESQ